MRFPLPTLTANTSAASRAHLERLSAQTVLEIPVPSTPSFWELIMKLAGCRTPKSDPELESIMREAALRQASVANQRARYGAARGEDPVLHQDDNTLEDRLREIDLSARLR